MKIYNVCCRFLLLIAILIQAIPNTHAQSGDQILDGIGETGMVARYVFDGNLKDWSRNNLHAKFQGSEAKYISDERFGKVLSLNGTSNAFVSLPSEAVADLESLSVSGWIYLRSEEAGQRLFDFGKDAGKNFSLMVSAPQPIAKNKWVHVAIVVDPASKTTITYVDGKPVNETKNTSANPAELFSQQSGSKPMLYIGKSLKAGDPLLNAMLHDFRIYRVPLSRKQVSGIYFNALKNVNEDTANMGKAEDNLPTFPQQTPQLYTSYLTQVADVAVETALGNLPRFPSFLQGTYRNNLAGPKVRVIWPADLDNSAVLKPGQYTVTGKVPGTAFQPKAVVTVKATGKITTPRLKLETFHLDQVALNANDDQQNTKFIENRDKFLSTLATTDPNTFLYMFRHAFGQAQPQGAKPLGVWDSEDTKLRGHATGHYLTAIAQAYSSTGYDKTMQAKFAEKMEYMVNTLFDLAQLSGTPIAAGATAVTDPRAVPPGPGKTTYDSDISTAGIRTDYSNWGKGFISAYPPDQFIMLEHGASYGGKINQIWAPYYTLHKILAGLMDVYEVSGNKKALDVATGMSDWVYSRLNELPKETLIKMWTTYIAGEFGGMNESMARLYRITKDQRYLKTAQLFDNIKLFYGDADHTHGLAKNVDTFRGLHANQHIPQIVGSIEMYRVNNNPDYFKVADNFWYKTTNDYMYSIGGLAGARNPANAECFVSQPSTLYENGFSAGGQNETCGTYNMLKLTSNLFLFDQRAELMDYYERGLYNHILSSVAKDSPANTYHVSLRPGSMKQFSNTNMTGFTCCNGTAIESSTKLQSSIYFKSTDNKSLYVNLFIPSTLDWTARQVKVIQTTNFPTEDHTKLTIQGHGKFDLQLRVPSWANKGYFVTINGKAQTIDAKPGSYLKLSRNWKDGDEIELKMPFQFHLDPVMDQQNIASLFYGPILLAAQEPEARKEWRKVTLDAGDLSKTISGDSKSLTFAIEGITFKPFYETYGRHSVYLDVTLK